MTRQKRLTPAAPRAPRRMCTSTLYHAKHDKMLDTSHVSFLHRARAWSEATHQSITLFVDKLSTTQPRSDSHTPSRCSHSDAAVQGSLDLIKAVRRSSSTAQLAREAGSVLIIFAPVSTEHILHGLKQFTLTHRLASPPRWPTRVMQLRPPRRRATNMTMPPARSAGHARQVTDRWWRTAPTQRVAAGLTLHVGLRRLLRPYLTLLTLVLVALTDLVTFAL